MRLLTIQTEAITFLVQFLQVFGQIHDALWLFTIPQIEKMPQLVYGFLYHTLDKQLIVGFTAYIRSGIHTKH